MCSFLISSFFLTLRTRLRISCISLQKILIDEVSVSDCMYYIINGICADGEQAKAFWFSEGAIHL